MKSLKLILTAIWIGIAPVYSQVSNAGLDATFANRGITPNILTNKKFKTVSAMVVQPDGKIIIAGEFIARFTSNGKLDSSFGGADLTGHFQTNGSEDQTLGAPGVCPPSAFTQGYDAYATGLALQPDGKIIVTLFGAFSPKVVRLLPNGKIDFSFGINGVAALCCGNATYVAIQPDGKIVVAGDGSYTAIVSRLQSNGSVDSSFAGKGYIETPNGFYQGSISGLGISENGRITLGGIGYNDERKSSVFAMRLMPDGTPDNQYGGDHQGIIYPFRADYCRDFFVLPGGEALMAIGGLSGTSAIYKLKNDGSVSKAFGNDGAFNVMGLDGVTSITPLADGKLLCGGWKNGDYALCRLLSNASDVDPSFGLNGIITTDITGYNEDYIHKVAVDGSGRIIAAGNGRIDNAHPPMTTIACYKNDAPAAVPGDPDENSQFALYPNPASKSCRIAGIDLKDIQQIRIVGVDGKLYQQIHNLQQLDIPLHSLSGGTYLVIIDRLNALPVSRLITVMP